MLIHKTHARKPLVDDTISCIGHGFVRLVDDGRLCITLTAGDYNVVLSEIELDIVVQSVKRMIRDKVDAKHLGKEVVG